MNSIKSKTKMSARDLWETPQWLVNQIQEILSVSFVLDPCSTEENKKAWCHLDKDDNGLEQNWKHIAFEFCYGEFVFNPAAWVNPPFSELDQWIEKAIQESQNGLVVAFLHPDTPDTAWYQRIEEHCFLQLVPTSRVNFVDPETGKEKSGVNFPSCISVFSPMPRINVQRIRFDLNKPKKVNV